ncbi:hypothetical protein, partial [Pseudomonas sp. BJa3]|uniref:hypothetical protein n=1 Tax=Pseudomonas sp. BJa3 TaxID=2986525 RepID=UPI002265A2F9
EQIKSRSRADQEQIKSRSRADMLVLLVADMLFFITLSRGKPALTLNHVVKLCWEQACTAMLI